MFEDFIIIGAGELILDVYFQESMFIGVNGGGSTWNTLWNLSNKGYSTLAIGSYCNDEAGEIAKESLVKAGVNVNHLQKKELQTKRIHINFEGNQINSTIKCPICGEKFWPSRQCIKLIPESIKESYNKGLILIDSLKKENIELIQKFEFWNSVIDIARIGNMRYLRKSQIISSFSHPFYIMQMNKTVYHFLLNRLELQDEVALFKLATPKLLIITKGSEGSTFIWKESEVINKKSFKPYSENVKDPTGAGDAFLSGVISSIITNEIDLTDLTLDTVRTISSNANKKAHLIASNIGARNYFAQSQYFNDKYISGKCICKGNEVKIKKKNSYNRFNTNIKFLFDRIVRANESSAYDKVCTLLDNINGLTIAIGSGGSYAPAVYAANIINSFNRGVCLVMKPREFINAGFCNVENLVLFSYSGRTKEILMIAKKISDKKPKTYLISKSNTSDIENVNFITFNDSKKRATTERGFLSIAGTLCPITLFGRYVFESQVENTSFFKLIDTLFKKWETFFDEENIEDKIEFYNQEHLVIDAFFDYSNYSAYYDIESKMIESGIGRVTHHEKKDFSHGRFTILNSLRPSIILYYGHNKNKYEIKLLNYLDDKFTDNIVILKSDQTNKSLIELDFVIANQFLLRKIGQILGKDVSKVSADKEAVRLYKYSGKLEI